MLRARSQTVGPWESFGLCPYGAYYLIFPLHEPAGRIPWVATEKDYTGDDYGMLRARSEAIGTWEQFTITWHGSGPDYITIKARANDRYVTTERNWTGSRFGMLRARSTTAGPWERFQ
ncbi:fascin domain-containing protein [Micromonospora rubida]|uniref:Fascin domain-containing protein n=1 Tax=Micromonospora rubida TaxID=2697657 RepID=A0ABW7SX63_9ACTN